LPLSPYRLGLLLTTLSAIAWSTTGLFTRAITLDAWTILFWRGIFGAGGLFVAIVLLEGRRGIRGFAQLGRPGWAYAVISGVGMIAFIQSLRLTTVAHVSIIYASVPFIAAALGWLVLREPPGRRALTASIAALGGIVIMVGAGREGGLFGDFLALVMTVVMAAMMVIARRFPGIPTLPAACLSGLLSALFAWPLATIGPMPGPDLAMLLGLGLVNSALGLALFIIGSRLLPPVETALIGALDAPLAPIWVWLVFAETPSHATFLGGAVVFAAVTWHIVKGAQGLRQTSQPVP